MAGAPLAAPLSDTAPPDFLSRSFTASSSHSLAVGAGVGAGVGSAASTPRSSLSQRGAAIIGGATPATTTAAAAAAALTLTTPTGVPSEDESSPVPAEWTSFELPSPEANRESPDHDVPTTEPDSGQSGGSGATGQSSQWLQLWDEEIESYYYFNETSGEASWVLPDDVEEGSVVARAGADTVYETAPAKGDEWEHYWDEHEGMWYSYNATTGETKWDTDEASQSADAVGGNWAEAAAVTTGPG